MMPLPRAPPRHSDLIGGAGMFAMLPRDSNVQLRFRTAVEQHVSNFKLCNNYLGILLK
jgi:hypothetical protein